MIRVTWFAIRSNERVILPKADGANIPTIFVRWNIIGKISATRTLMFFHSVFHPLKYFDLFNAELPVPNSSVFISSLENTNSSKEREEGYSVTNLTT